MSIWQIIARVKEHCIPGTFDCISKQTHTHTHKTMYICKCLLL